ncbi:MAG: hypothetical protein HOO06_03850 [Bdellovibrionaceae bacterium]|jgi:hypothetical protein|nr:hypothetical protein [Pseudobdellovibrionaceae bacterium]
MKKFSTLIFLISAFAWPTYANNPLDFRTNYSYQSMFNNGNNNPSLFGNSYYGSGANGLLNYGGSAYNPWGSGNLYSLNPGFYNNNTYGMWNGGNYASPYSNMSLGAMLGSDYSFMPGYIPGYSNIECGSESNSNGTVPCNGVVLPNITGRMISDFRGLGALIGSQFDDDDDDEEDDEEDEPRKKKKKRKKKRKKLDKQKVKIPKKQPRKHNKTKKHTSNVIVKKVPYGDVIEGHSTCEKCKDAKAQLPIDPPYEDDKNCTNSNSYLYKEYTRMGKDHTGRQLVLDQNDELSRYYRTDTNFSQCILGFQKNVYTEKGSKSYVKACNKKKYTLTAEKPCVDKFYHKSFVDSYEKVQKCLGLKQYDLMKNIAVESGFHINQVNPVEAAKRNKGGENLVSTGPIQLHSGYAYKEAYDNKTYYKNMLKNQMNKGISYGNKCDDLSKLIDKLENPKDNLCTLLDYSELKDNHTPTNPEKSLLIGALNRIRSKNTLEGIINGTRGQNDDATTRAIKKVHTAKNIPGSGDSCGVLIKKYFKDVSSKVKKKLINEMSTYAHHTGAIGEIVNLCTFIKKNNGKIKAKNLDINDPSFYTKINSGTHSNSHKDYAEKLKRISKKANKNCFKEGT